MKTIEVCDPRNLDFFMGQLRRTSTYALLPVVMQPDGPNALNDLALLECELIVRLAREISENDPDMVAVSLEDDPIVPEGVQVPLVAKVMAWRREQARLRPRGR